MTMTQSYYGGEFDALGRQSHRARISTGHYGRSVPYDPGYYEPQHELRSEYPGRPGARTLIEEHSPENGTTGNSRRRIQVACCRCRRRKIKCTGNPGDGSGCLACRLAQADKSSCTFNRVGSRDITLPGLEVLPISSGSASHAAPTAASYSSEALPNSYSTHANQASQQRPSLPVLHTRTAYTDYDSYNTSPVDDYTYAPTTLAKHESIPSNYSTEGFRPYTAEPAPGPSTNAHMYYEPGAALSFGSLHTAPTYQPSTPMARLPSVTGDTFSPLNMSSLHSSLPAQTVQERRLPVPYAPQQASYSSAEVPQIRPLTSFTEPQLRAQIGGIYTRHSMSWSMASPGVSRTDSINSLTTAASHDLAGMSSRHPDPSQNPAPLGYQFSAPPDSPDASPTAGAVLPESFSSASGPTASATSMLPPSNMRYGAGTMSHSSDTVESRRPSSSQKSTASLYSFSGGIETCGRATPGCHANQAGESCSTPSYQPGYARLQHPQPQHAASVDELRQGTSYDHQLRAVTSRRESVSNLNVRY